MTISLNRSHRSKTNRDSEDSKFELQRERERERGAMATTAKNMKGFYKQRKSNITGVISKSRASSRKVPPKHATTQGSDATQPAALISNGSLDVNDDYDKEEEMLRQFDMNMTYGPCVGMTRLDRWERALRLGMNPPNEIQRLLKTEKVQPDCLWQGRV